MELITDTPGEYHLTMYQGADFKRVLQFFDDNEQAIDLTPYTFTAQVREYYGGEIVVPIAIEKGSDSVTLTATPNAHAGTYVWDLRVEGDGATGVILRGEVNLRARVTV